MTKETAFPRGSVRSLAALAVAGMIGHGLVMTITGPVLPTIMVAFGIRETAVGILLAAGSLGFMVGCLLGGLATDEFGLKPVITAAWLGVVASLIGFALSSNYPLLLLTYALIGIGSGLVETGLNVLPAQIGGGAGMMNLVHMGYGVGALSAPLVAGLVLSSGGSWRLPYWLIAAVPTLLAVRGLTMPMPAAPKQQANHVQRQPLLTLLRHPLVVLSALVLLFYVAAEMSISNWVVLFMVQRFNLPPLQASGALTVFWGLVLIGRLLQGPLASRFSLPGLIVAHCIVMGVSILGLSQAQSSLVAYIFLIIVGLAASGIYPNVMIYTNRRYQRQVGAITGVLSMTAAAGSFAFQPIVGRVAETYGLPVGFLGLAGCMFVAGVFFLPIWLGQRHG
ncbi:MAG: MFS transporter [Anaerolineae bacterium]